MSGSSSAVSFDVKFIYIVWQGDIDGSINLKAFAKKKDAVSFKRGFAEILRNAQKLKVDVRKREDAWLARYHNVEYHNTKWYKQYLKQSQKLWEKLKEYSGNESATDGYKELDIEKMQLHFQHSKELK